MSLTQWIRKLFPLFTPLEMSLLAALQSHLDPVAADRFAQQLRMINLVQRHRGGKEVCCYHMRRSKPYRDPALQFPAKDLELKFAVINFSVPPARTAWLAEFWLIEGYFLAMTISSNSSQHRVGNTAAPVINEVKILHDPMAEHADLRSVKPQLQKLDVQKIQFPEWLGDLVRRGLILDAFEPLERDRRNFFLARTEAVLPVDYLEVLETCEGFQTEQWSVLGSSQVYEVMLDDGPYLIVAEHCGRGVLAARIRAPEALLYYFDYEEKAPVFSTGSLRSAIEAERG
jgi:hypothetical protein